MEEKVKRKPRPRRFGFRIPPVKVGEEYRVKIESKGKQGDGFAKVKGFAVFVKGAEVGDEVDVKIVKVFPRFAIAELKG